MEIKIAGFQDGYEHHPSLFTLGLACEMLKYSSRRALFWQFAKNRKRRLALLTALRTVNQRRQVLLQVASLTVLLLANNKEAAVFSSGLDISNDFRYLGLEIVFVQRMLVRGLV